PPPRGWSRAGRASIGRGSRWPRRRPPAGARAARRARRPRRAARRAGAPARARAARPARRRGPPSARRARAAVRRDRRPRSKSPGAAVQAPPDPLSAQLGEQEGPRLAPVALERAIADVQERRDLRDRQAAEETQLHQLGEARALALETVESRVEGEHGGTELPVVRRRLEPFGPRDQQRCAALRRVAPAGGSGHPPAPEPGPRGAR